MSARHFVHLALGPPKSAWKSASTPSSGVAVSRTIGSAAETPEEGTRDMVRYRGMTTRGFVDAFWPILRLRYDVTILGDKTNWIMH